MPARLLVADDHAVVRQGLREMLAGCADLRIVAEVADGLEAERLARVMALDLIILDVAMPGRRGIEVLKSLRADGLTVPVVFFSMYPAAQYADQILRVGAQCFLSKDADADTIIACLRRVLAGERCPPPPGTPAGPVASSLAKLSAREREVLDGLTRGLPARTIAGRLGITDKSVATYRRRILDKLGVANNAELLAFVLRSRDD